MIVFQNKIFDFPSNLLQKLKDNKHQEFVPPCQDLVYVLRQFNYFKDQNVQTENELIELAAAKVFFKTYKQGEYLTDQSQEDIIFILKGEVGLFEERNDREIKQEHYWRQQISKIKRKIEETKDENEKVKLEEEYLKAEKVFNFYYKHEQVKLLSKDIQRHQINFNIDNECLYKQTQIIKSGVCVGPLTDHFERSKSSSNYQIVALNAVQALVLNQQDQREIFKKNAQIQTKLFCILSKYFQSVAFERDILQKVMRGVNEMCFTKNQSIYHENFDTSQFLYVLVEGQVEISAKRLKQQILIDTINSNEIFGTEFLAANRSLRQFTARSQINPTKIFAISYETMKSLFNEEIMNEIKNYGEKINNQYQETLSSHLKHIVNMCRQKGMKIPLNYQSNQITASTSANDQTVDNNTTTTLIHSKSNNNSRSPFKRSTLQRLSKKHSSIIEESIQNLKRQQTQLYCNSMSGNQSGSTNTSLLYNSGFENKISALYNQISNKTGSNVNITCLKSRQNSIEMDLNEIVPPRVHFQQASPSIDSIEDKQIIANACRESYYPKAQNSQQNYSSPQSGNQKQKAAQLNSKITQNQLLKRYLSSRYSKQSQGENYISQNFEDEVKRVEPLIRMSNTIAKDKFNSQAINLQNQNTYQLQETPGKHVFEDMSPIKKMRQYSVREPKKNQQNENNQFFESSDAFTANIIQQRRILKQFKVKEEAEKYINSESTTKSCQNSPVKRIKDEINIYNTPSHKNNQADKSLKNIYQSHYSLDKYKNKKNFKHRHSQSIASSLQYLNQNQQNCKKQDQSPFQNENNRIMNNNYLSYSNFCKSLTNI
ncbi:cyclic nucleotide-binding domain protein (macronuclear) [Tetrahymena thermophila SB210]|uniref:Cyclic nucleotide-binding domain protein n=1 Tax=Tetrahymena thermophila (strain SB210) TaxID=312017 RepID=Q22D89_TETTS|nr:cyclic nucleotide-binding domain protein [Tetrahymena thermophila SB210]EAR83236.2 cyclic nucleotide-binding domain protein [Tetrahymena thermophila SB210]|eukprot:XP_001030899.2 cyclic nucleotide-binding domain protein [Tetrahymena thermophila SB210]